MIATSRAAIALLILAVAGTGLGGCVYRPNIQQGNLLDVEDIEQVAPGMTRSQVRYLLGTPMLANPFDPQRWDYVYTLRRGRESNVDRAHLVVRFEGDKVSSVEKLDVLDERNAPVDAKKAEKENKKSAEQLRQTGTAPSLERGDEPAPAPPPDE